MFLYNILCFLPGVGRWLFRQWEQRGTSIANLGALCSVFGVGYALYRDYIRHESVPHWIYAGFLVFVTGTLLLRSGRLVMALEQATKRAEELTTRTEELSRDARYAGAMSVLETAVMKMMEQLRTTTTRPEKIAFLHHLMDDISQSFGILTGVPCRSCIKVIVTGGPVGFPTLWAGTLCRNMGYRGPEPHHAIRDNTGFGIFHENRELPWFFGNNLPKLEADGRYRNTTKDWKSRYQSTLIWPFRNGTEVAAYLCVDSKNPTAFRETDFPIGATIVNVLRPFLDRILA